MKPGIHPNYVTAVVSCSCGNTWETRSTKQNLRTDLCSTCHPFYSGEQRIVDSAGQVERFNNKIAGAQQDRGMSKKQSLRAAKLAEVQRARTFTPEMEAIAGAGEGNPQA